MKTAIYPGSFDPITLGHLNVIKRAANIFDRLIVCVGYNSKKNPMFSPEERVRLIREVTKDMENVEVEASDELLAQYAQRKGACVIVKGLRAVSDFEYEFQMALANRKLYAGAETVFLTTTTENMYLSSSVVKQIAAFGGDISHFVPPEILDFIEKRLVKERQS